MSTWYYGILYEDENTVMAMYVGKNFFDPEEALKTHVEYARTIVENLENISGTLKAIQNSPLNKKALTKLGKVISAIREAYTPELLFYAVLCVITDIEPKIISEYTLFEHYRDELGKEVVVLGEEL